MHLVLIISLYLQNYLLADEDIGGRKSSKAKELGHVTSYLFSCHFFKICFHICLNALFLISFRTSFLTEDGLFDMIRASKPANATVQEESKKKTMLKPNISQPKSSPLKTEVKGTVETTSLHVFIMPFIPQNFLGTIYSIFIGLNIRSCGLFIKTL